MSTPWHTCRIVAFDTETTGLNPWDGDRVIEFGAVELGVDPEGGVRHVKRHNWLINPEVSIPRAASRISGITDEDVADKPKFGELALKIREVLAGGVVVAHNLAFDLGCLRAEFERCNLHWPATVGEIDTLRLAQARLDHLRSFKLENVCKELGVPLDNAHRASHDAEACGRVFVEIARRCHAPHDLEEMIVWADAVGPPPDTGHLEVSGEGVPVFLDGPFQGASVERHPDHLQWMIIALERRAGAWHPRYPDSLREWARRWLRARAAGRARANPRSQGAADWNLDPIHR